MYYRMKFTPTLPQITYYCIEYISSWAGFELTTFVVIGTDCIGRYKLPYDTTPENVRHDYNTYNTFS